MCLEGEITKNIGASVHFVGHVLVLFSLSRSKTFSSHRFFEWRIEEVECLDESVIFAKQIGWSPDHIYW